MADDPFQDLLELEDEYYKEGYDAGVADSTYAGMIEGKVFGIEKGYEKALELAKLHGRAVVWNTRVSMESGNSTTMPTAVRKEPRTTEQRGGFCSSALGKGLDPLPPNARLRKHIENLLSITDGTTMDKANTDEAVTEFDDRLIKARAKAKIISNIVGEPLNPTAAEKASIEDATGLDARR